MKLKKQKLFELNFLDQKLKGIIAYNADETEKTKISGKFFQ